MTVSSQIIEVLQYLASKLGIVIDWTSDNVVPYIQNLMEHYIMWEITKSKVAILICAVISIASIILAIIVNKTCDDDLTAIAVVVCVICVLTSIIICSIEAFDLIRCIKFPELQVYTYIESLLSAR